MNGALVETVRRARELLGLDYREISRALQVHPSTLYRWRTDEASVSDRGRRRSAALSRFLDEVERAFPEPDLRREWFDAPLKAFAGRTPREFLQAGRTDLLAGYLVRDRAETAREDTPAVEEVAAPSSRSGEKKRSAGEGEQPRRTGGEPSGVVEAGYDEAPVPLCLVDRELRVVRMNRGMAAVTGESAAGTPLRRLLPGVGDDVEHRLRAALADDEPARDVDLPRRGGRGPPEGAWRIHMEPVRSEAGAVVGGSVVLEDVGEALRSRRRLRRSLGSLRSAVRAAPYPVTLAALDGEILEVSRALLELTGRSRGDLLTLDGWFDTLFGEDRERAREWLEAVLAGDADPSAGEWPVRTRSGEIRIWDFTPIPLDPLPDGRPVALLTALDVTDRKRSMERMRLLADAGATFTEEYGSEEILDALAKRMVRTVADFAIAYLRTGDGTLRRVARAHRNPAKDELLERLDDAPPLPEDHPLVRRLFETGDGILLRPVRGESLATISEHVHVVERLEPISAIAVPLIGRDGPVGAIAVFTCEGGRPAFVDEDRTTVAEIARRAGVTIDNERLQREERQARRWAQYRADRLAALQRATAALTRALTVEDVRDALVDEGASALGADGGALILVSDDGEWLEVTLSSESDERLREEWSRLPARADPPTPGSEVVETGESLFISSLEEWRQRYPHLDDLLEELGGRSICYVPVERRGRTVGALALRFPDERAFPDDERTVLEALGQLAAHGLERARLFEAERRAREEAEVANVAKSQFLSVVSHELRTPLNGILGNASILDEGIPGELSPGQREHVQRIRAAADHLTSLIDEILTYSRAEAGKQEVRTAVVDVRNLVREVAELLEPRAAGKDLGMRVSVPDEPVEVRTDAGKVRQILLNLVGNAVKFTDEGRVEIRLRDDGERPELEVRDTGPGIPPDARDRIFEPFVQVDQTRTRRKGGTGMGLAVVARQAELLEAELEVEEAPGGGALFRLRLPGGDAPLEQESS